MSCKYTFVLSMHQYTAWVFAPLMFVGILQLVQPLRHANIDPQVMTLDWYQYHDQSNSRIITVIVFHSIVVPSLTLLQCCRMSIHSETMTSNYHGMSKPSSTPSLKCPLSILCGMNVMLLIAIYWTVTSNRVKPLTDTRSRNGKKESISPFTINTNGKQSQRYVNNQNINMNSLANITDKGIHTSSNASKDNMIIRAKQLKNESDNINSNSSCTCCNNSNINITASNTQHFR